MRSGAAISVFAHVAALTACLVLAGVRPFDPAITEAINVDIVTPEDAPPIPKEPESTVQIPETPKPSETSEVAEKQPEQSTQKNSQQAPPPEPPPAAKPASPPSQPNLQQAAAQTQPVEPPAPQPQPAVPVAQPDITQRFGMMFSLPDQSRGEFDAVASSAANITLNDAAALRAHLKTCSILPQTISPSDNIKIVLRAKFLPNGRLAAEPLLIQASASEKGPALMLSAMKALETCQPYAMLPADKYDQWKMLDLSFSPKDFKGG
ncbi:MAG: cell envelope biogenesis protein TolA [Pseudomonadota bacterium]